MFSSIFVTIILLFIQSISGQHVQDNRVIIGSSVGGILGLVSVDFVKERKTNNCLYSYNQF